MPSMREIEERVENGFKKARDDFLEPPFFSTYFETVTRSEQVGALLILPFIIVFSFGLLVALHNVLAAVMFQGDSLGEQEGIMQFMVTGLTMLSFIGAAWFWFMWVRTGGFRMMRLSDD